MWQSSSKANFDTTRHRDDADWRRAVGTYVEVLGLDRAICQAEMAAVAIKAHDAMLSDFGKIQPPSAAPGPAAANADHRECLYLASTLEGAGLIGYASGDPNGRVELKPPTPASVTIRALRRHLLARRFAVPKLQRNFVWDAVRAAKLLDRIYRDMPIYGYSG